MAAAAETGVTASEAQKFGDTSATEFKAAIEKIKDRATTDLHNLGLQLAVARCLDPIRDAVMAITKSFDRLETECAASDRRRERENQWLEYLGTIIDCDPDGVCRNLRRGGCVISSEVAVGFFAYLSGHTYFSPTHTIYCPINDGSTEDFSEWNILKNYTSGESKLIAHYGTSAVYSTRYRAGNSKFRSIYVIKAVTNSGYTKVFEREQVFKSFDTKSVDKYIKTGTFERKIEFRPHVLRERSASKDTKTYELALRVYLDQIYPLERVGFKVISSSE